MQKTLKLGIIGQGFVGSAVSSGFNKNVDQFVVDPKYNDNTIDELVKYDPPLLFVCVPTPEAVGDSGDVDVSIVRQTLSDLANRKYKGVVVIKSTITPHHLIKFKKDFSGIKIVYNPEFLTEANSKDDFINPSMQILGGSWKYCEIVEKAYIRHSAVKVVPTFKTDLITASMLKYTINSFLATKVTFFNELYDLFNESGTSVPWESFVDMISRDERIGKTHMQVPGPDGKFGFGGHCFPKDTQALLYYAQKMGKSLSVLSKSVKTNKTQRNK